MLPGIYPCTPEEMVDEQIVARGITDRRVVKAMKSVPRECFVPDEYKELAYSDQPLPIGYGQTISQPYVVAFMTQELEIEPASKVLEIGTGSGYQTAILAEIAEKVYTVEVIEELSKRAEEALTKLGYRNIKFKVGDGREGWKEFAPFSRIIVTAASEDIPPELITQCEVGGIIVIPVGPKGWTQDLVKIRKLEGGITEQRMLPVRFVPLVKGKGKKGKKRRKS
ncbi:MAG: protein-L-isoaspartate(D-aspartate) O-methyltransferase [Candidatus Marinimicrobia bacterium]|nr:protein-L-isoaspartate(D-aspartate) O-methyltransferase [Candidatus Neomarinimicrobiota bacterium]